MSEKKKLPLGVRIGFIVVLIGGTFALSHYMGWTEDLTLDQIREWMTSMGIWGFLLFLALFALGELIHIPGIVFMVAAILAYGPWLGWLASYVGGLVSVTVAFFIIRGVGGQMLEEVKWSWMQKALDRLDEAPIRTVTILRLIFWVLPPLNYALALSSIKFRDYFIGSAIGLILPLAGVALFVDFFVAMISS